MTITRLFAAPGIVLFLCFLISSFQSARADVDAVSATPTAHAIAIAPALPIGKFSIENRGSALDVFAGAGWLIKKNIEVGRIAEFRNLLSAYPFNVQEELALAAATALREYRQTVMMGDGIRYAEDDPGAIDHKKSKVESEMALVITVFDMGLASNRFSTKFVPRLNVSFDLIDMRTEESVYSQSIYYGADANKNAEDQITADPRYSYDSFESAIERKKELIEGYRDGARKMANLVGMQIRSLNQTAASESN